MPKPEKMAPATKYGREDGRVPAREQRDGEVKRDDGVDGEDERGRDAGEDQVGHLVVLQCRQEPRQPMAKKP